MNDRADSRETPLLAGRKVRDRALILPLVGVLLLLPPIAGIFELELWVAGVPFTAAYLFAVWAALIAFAAALSRVLRDRQAPEPAPADPARDTAD